MENTKRMIVIKTVSSELTKLFLLTISPAVDREGAGTKSLELWSLSPSD